jgi:DNA-binding SARP family transcriptional activator
MREWLRQSERYALAGRYHHAEALLEQVWNAAESTHPAIANHAAWELAWLLVRSNRFAEAAAWFSRVGSPPNSESPLWPATRLAQIRICEQLADQFAGSTPSHLPLSAAASPPLPVLEVTNLGRFSIVIGGRELADCKARKAVSLFRYLLSRAPRGAHKEELMELLWPNSGPNEAAHSLHVTVSALRRYLDPPQGSYILFEAGCYQLNPEATIEDDSRLFWQLSQVAEQRSRAGELDEADRAYARAIAIYQGDYYVDSRDLAWALAEQEKLLVHYLTMLDHHGRLLIALERYEPAIERYRQVIERDSYREDAHCQLMICYSALGRRGEAVQQYKRCAAILASELGLEPMPETQALYQRIAHSL